MLDSLLVEPGSIRVSQPYAFVDSTQQIRVKATTDSVEVCYRVLSSLLTHPFQNRDMATYDDSGEGAVLFNDVKPPIEQAELFAFGGVEKYGAISRGVTFGNRQSLFVNSTLNLQMEGKMDENLNISAVITDQNVPYQPEGNTQQIRDFDNVFIKLYNEQFDLTAGDIVLQQPTNAGYFLRYYKNIQGLQASVKGGDEGWSYESRVSGALSKGKFNSAFIDPVDGLSGPYKLRGPNGERFIIVLANSEKVFLDGKQLERGFDRDYVIDYNLGEITFNNHLVITQFSIIRVDYEYAEQFYSRSNFSAYQSVKRKNVTIYGNFYQEQDNPNANLGFSLDERDLRQLRQIGDQQDLALVTGFDTVQYSENRIQYALRDTVDLDGQSQQVLVYSTNQNEMLVNATFSEVGTGNGDYVLKQSTVNGRVYEWVSPQLGQSQGNYRPGAIVPLPNKRQLITAGVEVALSAHESVRAEVAISNRDDNRYSVINDDDNIGKAYFMEFKSAGRKTFLDGYEWQSGLSMEYDEQNFTYIDRYRSILFDRDWNLNGSLPAPAEDVLLFGSVALKKDENNRIQLAVNHRNRGEEVEGWQQQLDVNQELAAFRLTSSHFHLESDGISGYSTWWRSRSDLSFRAWKVAPGFIYEVDENKTLTGDSVVASLMNYRAREWYLSSTDSSKATFRVSYQVRDDQRPVGGELVDYLRSENVRGAYAISGADGSLTLDVNYRKVDEQLGLNAGEDEVINGRVNWVQSFLKSHLRHNVSFSTGNSRELRREFVFLPVNTGEGTHTWRDVNGDGEQDLNEFFEAINPDERNYVKIFTPTDDYLTAFQTFYIHTIDARLPARWRGDGFLKSMLSQVSVNVNLNVNFKTTADDYLSRLNPFGTSLDDPQLIASQDIKRYTLFFNRNGRGFGADVTRQTADNKQLLTQGFETREKGEWISNVKMDLSSEYTLRLTTTHGRQLNQSDFLSSRNFEIVQSVYRPQLIWQPSNHLRLVGSYERKTKQNEFTESTEESVRTEAYTGEFTWNQSAKGSLRSSFSYLQIDFNGDPASYLGYLLLDALQPGANQTWQVNWQQRLSKGMQLSLIYNGRKAEGTPAIHTGSMQVTAYF